MRVLLHAINGVGLGHIARLSVITEAIRRQFPDIELNFYSNSKYASPVLNIGGITVPLERHRRASEQAAEAYHGFLRSIRWARPHIIVCDTHWPRPIIGQLRRRGVRTVLILRLVAKTRIGPLLWAALRDFDLIVVPHAPAEILFLYESDQTILRLLRRPEVLVCGPLARQVDEPPQFPQVLFSLGGGGEYVRGAPRNSIANLLSIFMNAHRRLLELGILSRLARGPLLSLRSVPKEIPSSVETLELHKLIGPRTVVVSRAGYNTCFETLAQGAKLILVGNHSGYEDVAARAIFLERQGLAVIAEQRSDAIVEVIRRTITTPWDAREIRRRTKVNDGARVVAKIVVRG